LYALFREMRFYIAKLDVPAIREFLVANLMAAIDDAHNRARKAKDVEDRLEYYRVIGYLCQIIDGLVLNDQKDEITRANRDMEKRLKLLEAAGEAEQGIGKSPTSSGGGEKPEN